MEVFLREDGERGVRAKRQFNSGEFVVEFEGNLLSREDYRRAEIEYAKENLPLYTLEVSSEYIYTLLPPYLVYYFYGFSFITGTWANY